MVAFVSGIHGSGKTYLCEKYIELRGNVVHKSSSALIRQAKSGANWNMEKRVDDADANQIALTQEVKKITAYENRLILDGHTVLLGKDGQFVFLSSSVFSQLGISLIVLIEASVEKISQRIRDRDSTKDIADLEKFIIAEREQARLISKELSIPLKILSEPTVSDFSRIIDDVFFAK